MANAGDNVRVAEVKAWNEVGIKRGSRRDSGGWVSVAKEVRVDPCTFPPCGRAVFFIREPSLIPAVDAVFFTARKCPARSCGVRYCA